MKINVYKDVGKESSWVLPLFSIENSPVQIKLHDTPNARYNKNISQNKLYSIDPTKWTLTTKIKFEPDDTFIGNLADHCLFNFEIIFFFTLLTRGQLSLSYYDILAVVSSGDSQSG